MDKLVFLLLHGYQGNQPIHWQECLSNELKKAGQEVITPLFPQPNEPKLEEWIKLLEDKLKGVNKNQLVIAAHSLGCSLWIQYVHKNPEIKPKKGFLVSPPLNNCGIKEIDSFFPLPNIDLSNQDTLIIGSNNDGYIKENEFKELSEKINSPLKILSNAGHITAPEYGNWTWINNECLNLIKT